MLRSYLLLAWKVLRRRPFFTATSLFGIAFTLSVLTVASALYESIANPGEPLTRAGRVLGVYDVRGLGPHMCVFSSPGYGLLDRCARSLPGAEKVTVFGKGEPMTSFLEGRKIVSQFRRTDGAYWELLQFRFLEGAPFTADDDSTGAFVAVVNATTRRRFFGSEPATGKSIVLGGRTYRVVGVVKDVPITCPEGYADVWTPIGTSLTPDRQKSYLGGYQCLVLAHSRADFANLRAEFARRVAEVQIPDQQELQTLTAALESRQAYVARGTFNTEIGRDVSARLSFAVFFVMLLFMTLPAINLVNLTMSRVLERSSEIGIRRAFGASARSLIGQFLVENLVLTGIAGIAGLLLAAVLLSIVNRSGLVPYAHFGIDLRVFLDGLALALFFGLWSGVYPAWRMSRMDPIRALQGRLS